MNLRTEPPDLTKMAVHDRRLYRMKHMRFDGMRIVDMLPTLTAEGLLPEHENHETKAPWKKGHRSDARNAEVCARCEHMAGEQWRYNVRNLTSEETRWIWYADMERLAERCLNDYREPYTITTTKTKRIMLAGAKEGDAPQEADAIETTVREGVRIYPALLDLYRVTLNDMARLAGVPVGEMDESEADEPEEQNVARGGLVIKRPPPRSDPSRVN